MAFINQAVYNIMLVVPELFIGIIFGILAVSIFGLKFPGRYPEAILWGVFGAFFGELILFIIPVVRDSPRIQHTLFGIVAGIVSILFLVIGSRLRQKKA